ncbi:SNF1-related protein kinase regulatory subunit gamma-1-like [Apostasia shenzhenica]|uniref:SNF1-related protein kinase regulatory subunit gamma-1-like n=1 Tax=Apostasia shenzhenica TaxID=1088818 RepID=A0A2I0A602_9ASPA|nr:SNF1-related protein kinase regulatory subunit gamma-1-like [Apostasia shenzhenica]
MAQIVDGRSKIPSCDAYFDAIQSRKKLPHTLQESLIAAFAQIPVSSFPEVPGGNVIEIPSDTTIIDAVRILSEHNISSAPVRNVEIRNTSDWEGTYLGIIDYSAIVLWVLENAELAAFSLSAGSATVAAIGTSTVGGIGTIAAGATGPATIAGLTIAAVGAALVGGIASEKTIGKDAATAADHLGEQFYRLLLQEEPFKSTTVKSVVETYRWAPFLPVASDSSMLTVLLLLSKYRLRNVPVIENGGPYIRNFITQSAVVQGLKQCKGRDWFDCIAARQLLDLGLPFMSYDEYYFFFVPECDHLKLHTTTLQVVSIKQDELILEAFKRMKDYRIGGLPVIEGPKRKIVGSLSIHDIRFLLLKPKLFSGFRQLSVMDFMKAIRSDCPESGKPLLEPLACSADAFLGDVIDSLASRGLHRIYVEEENEVVGIVTLRDVISCFIYEPPDYFEDYFRSAVSNLFSP